MIRLAVHALSSYPVVRSALVQAVPSISVLPSILKLRFPFFERKMDGAAKPGDYRFVLLTKRDLRESYAKALSSIEEIRVDMAVAAAVSSFVSAGWIHMTSTSLLHSPVATLSALAGAVYLIGKGREIRSLREGLKCSVCLTPPAQDEEVNEVIRRIIAGDRPRFLLNSFGMQIFGPLGDLAAPSTAKEKALYSVHGVSIHTVPYSMLGLRAQMFVSEKTRAWSSLFTERTQKESTLPYPLRFPYAPYLGFFGREKDELERSRTPEEVLEFLFDPKDLEGSLSFLREWVKSRTEVGVRICPDGSVVLSTKGQLPFFDWGPYSRSLPERNRFFGWDGGRGSFSSEAATSPQFPFLLGMGAVLYQAERTREKTPESLPGSSLFLSDHLL